MSSSDSLIPKTHPYNQQLVASCHTGEVISIEILLAPPKTQEDSRFLRWGGGTPTMFGMDVLT